MPLASIITAKPPGSYRRDLTLSCGFRFQANRSIVVTGLGQAVLSLFNQSHLVQLWTNAGSLVASCTVSPSSNRIGDFAYELITPVTLTSGSVYRIACAFVSGGDNWADNQSIAGYYSAADITVTGSVYTIPDQVFPNVVVSSGTFAYGWPTLIEGSLVNLGQRRKTAKASIRSTF